MTQQNERLSSRDHRAWADIFDKLDTLGEEVRSLRIRIAHELGFERVRASALRKGDRVRDTSTGAWYSVLAVNPHIEADDEAVARGFPFYRILFEESEGFMEVEGDWDGHPWPAMVTRAVVVDQEPF